MDKKTVFVFSDGRHDCGEGTGDGPFPMDTPLPPLPALVHRILGQSGNVVFRCEKFSLHANKKKRSRTRYGPESGLGHRYVGDVLRALARAEQAGAQAAVITVDRDGSGNADRHAALEDGRKHANSQDLRMPCAVGQAVESFDAWMIADHRAVTGAGGNTHGLTGKPESEKKPKACAGKAFNCHPDGRGLGPYYHEVAANARIETLKEVCPKGFKPFADDVRTHIGPLFAGGGRRCGVNREQVG